MLLLLFVIGIIWVSLCAIAADLCVVFFFLCVFTWFRPGYIPHPQLTVCSSLTELSDLVSCRRPKRAREPCWEFYLIFYSWKSSEISERAECLNFITLTPWSDFLSCLPPPAADGLAYSALLKNELLGAGIEKVQDPQSEDRRLQPSTPAKRSLFSVNNTAHMPIGWQRTVQFSVGPVESGPSWENCDDVYRGSCATLSKRFVDDCCGRLATKCSLWYNLGNVRNAPWLWQHSQ